MAREHELAAAAREVWQELQADVAAVAPELWGDSGGPDAEQANRGSFVEHVRALWPYPDLRMQLFQRMVPLGAGDIPARAGMEAWEALMKEAFPMGWQPPPPPVPESPLNAEVAATQQVVEPPMAGLTGMAL